MAKRTKTKSNSKVKLPPFPWEETVTLPDGTTARTARGKIEQGWVVDEQTVGPDGEIVTRRSRVWRRRTPDAMRTLNRTALAAMLDYAEAAEAVGGSVGGCDLTSGGGGGGGKREPSLRAVQAAERLRHMNGALTGREAVLPARNADRRRRANGTVRLDYATLAEWVAVEGFDRGEILPRAGAATSSERAQDELTFAISDMGECLAVCNGYVAPPRAECELRNTPTGDV